MERMANILHTAEGKKKPSLGSLSEKLTEAQKACIEASCLDRAGAYQNVVGEQVPTVTVVYERFHLHLNPNASTDDVRRQVNAEEKAIIKGSRLILLANGENPRGR